MESQTKIHEIIEIKSDMPYEDVIEQIFSVGTLITCRPKKRPSVFVRLTMDKKTTYPFRDQANWEALIKMYHGELAKKGNAAAAEIIFPETVSKLFIYLSRKDI